MPQDLVTVLDVDTVTNIEVSSVLLWCKECSSSISDWTEEVKRLDFSARGPKEESHVGGVYHEAGEGTGEEGP